MWCAEESCEESGMSVVRNAQTGAKAKRSEEKKRKEKKNAHKEMLTEQIEGNNNEDRYGAGKRVPCGATISNQLIITTSLMLWLRVVVIARENVISQETVKIRSGDTEQMGPREVMC